MQIYPVDPRTITLTEIPSKREIRGQVRRLEVEGQIEPIAVTPELVIDKAHPDYWVYSSAQVMAAIELNWSTILVTY